MFNLKKNGVAVAISSNNKEIIYYNKDKTNHKSLHISGDILNFLPSLDSEACLFVAKSGQGKTYSMCQYAEQYHKMHPKHKIYIVSIHLQDPTIDLFKFPYKKIKIEQDVENDDEDPHYWLKFFNKDSLIIMDDLESLQTSNKSCYNRCMKMQNTLLINRRHINCSLLISKHILLDGIRSKLLLAESDKIVVFGANGHKSSIKNYLYRYHDVSSSFITKVNNLQSRYKCLDIKNMICIGEHDLFSLY